MKDWVARHPLSSFFVVAYAVSWSIAVPLALQARGVLSERLPWSLHYLTAFGPAAAALLIARLLREPPETSEHAEPGSVARVGFWWTVGLGSPLLLFAIALIAARIAGQAAPSWMSLGHVNFLDDLGLAAWGLWFATSGVGEELGWRGFALPRLQRTHSAMTSTLLLAIGWAGWHLPAFFYVPSYTAIGLRILPGFFLGVLAGAVVLTWLYNSSRGSVFAVVLWHASFNFVTASPNAAGLVAAVTSTLVMLWAIVVVWRCDWATLATPLGSIHTARAIDTTPHGSAFRTPEGEAAFLAAYDAAIKRWPVSLEEVDIPSRYGTTHVVVSGPADAPPLVLLHGYQATLTMWAPNIAAFSRDFRVHAIDVMGQPGRSLPAEPIRDATDLVAWLTATLDALHLHRVSLAGMSYGGWVALNYAIAAPGRVEKLVLLSPGGLMPLATQFKLRSMLMVLFPTRFTVGSIMSWLGFTEGSGETDPRPMLDLMYLGLKHFRAPPETLRAMPSALRDEELSAIHAPVLLLIGGNEVVYDPVKAAARARRLIPNLQVDLIPRAGHDMCFHQHRVVDARVLDFLNDRRRHFSDRVVA